MNGCHRVLTRGMLGSVCATALWLSGATLTNAEPRVAGFDELVIYVPGTMDRDIPGVDLQLDPEFGWQADVQSTLHVHRYFYNGDKEFQGPLMQGGPTVVCACHPRTGKRLYIQVNLPSGAPVIVYDEDQITYVFQNMRVVLSFKMKDGCEAIVMTYKEGRGWCRIKKEHEAVLVKQHQEFSDKIPLKRTVKEAGKTVKETAVGAAGAVTTGASAVVTRAKDTFSALPVITQLQGLGKENSARANKEVLKQAGETAKSQATEFQKTLR